MRFRMTLYRATLWMVLAGSVATSAAAAETGRRGPLSSLEDRGWRAQQATARPWTREEMMSAVPDDIPGVTEADIASWAPDAAPDKASGPGMIPPVLPEGERRSAAGEGLEVPAPVLAGEAGERPLGYGYPAPFTRYETFPAYTNFPHVTVGKVFFTKPGIGNFVCSASSIGGDGVFTAAHCVHDSSSNTFWTNWVFVPAYKDGAAPFGQWTANHLWVQGAWVNGGNGDFRFDFGGAVLNRRSGKKLSQVVGSLGFMWNANANAHWTLIGYPQAPPFNGRLQQICQSSYAYSAGGAAPDPVGVGCDLTGGSSGGPWIRSYAKGASASNYLNGVNSFGRCTNPSCTTLLVEMFSPYFTEVAKALRDCIVNSVPGNPADPAHGCAPGT
jgi:V8-like Glu-specific endopeptidase